LKKLPNTSTNKNMKAKYLLLLGCLALPVVVSRAQDATAPAAAAPAVSRFTGKVTETMSTAGYTYVQVDTGKQKVWAAAVQFAVKVGDTVSFSPGDPMPNYHSKSLNRDFDLVYFTGGIDVVNDAAAQPVAAATETPQLPPGHPALPGVTTPKLPAGHPPITGQVEKARPNLDLTGIKRAEGGQTVAEIVTGAGKLAGKSVVVRGKVVKYNAQILGKNWLHIRDGSGSAAKADGDLAITTDTDVKVGDTVLVTGKVSVNKDFGGGYKYAVIIEDAKVVVE